MAWTFRGPTQQAGVGASSLPRALDRPRLFLRAAESGLSGGAGVVS